MGQKRFVVVFVVLLALSIISACGGGSGSSTPAVAAPDGSGGNTSAGDPGQPSGGNSGSPEGSVSLAWNAPLTNEDGTPLRDLAGYRVHYGTSSRTYSTTVEVGTVTSCSIGDLLPGTYFITVTAYNAGGAESGYSNEVTKTVL